jgi:hypothetical protein
LKDAGLYVQGTEDPEVNYIKVLKDAAARVVNLNVVK